MKAKVLILTACVAAALIPTCVSVKPLPTNEVLKAVLLKVIKEKNGGFGTPQWAAVVDRSGIVTAVAASEDKVEDTMIGSRVAAAVKAHSGVTFSLPGFAQSSANLYGMMQPGGALAAFGSVHPVNPAVSLAGPASDYGTDKDPLLGHRLGGLTGCGGGLGLYDQQGGLIGGLGLSGDSCCADHIIAWKMRKLLKLDFVKGGWSAAPVFDNLVFGNGTDAYSHPFCNQDTADIIHGLPTTHPAGTAGRASRASLRQ